MPIALASGRPFVVTLARFPTHLKAGEHTLINLRGIEKTYDGVDGPVTALRGITLNIARGEIFGIIGLSGAGKSTLIRCVNLLERPTAGTVTVNGQDMTALSDSELRNARKRIGMIFQHFNLLSSATVYDNVAFPLRLSKTPEEAIRGKVSSLLALVGLDDKAHQYPSQLSGGQKQRVGIARALANDPDVLLSDEATSALDPQTTKAILSLIRDINRKLGLTVVVITHEMGVIRDICDKVAVIENGVIAEQGNVVRVFTDPQEAITKDFIRAVIPNELPVALKDVPLSPAPQPGSSLLIRLTFIGASVGEPFIAGIIRRFPVDVSILYGNIDSIKDTPFGRLLVSVSGEPQAIDDALAYINETHTRAEIIGYYVPR